MRARKDPIALQLAKNNKVLMPNLSLTKKELGDVMDYMEAMSTLKSKPEAPQAEVAPGAAAGREQQAVLAHEHQHHDHATDKE